MTEKVPTELFDEYVNGLREIENWIEVSDSVPLGLYWIGDEWGNGELIKIVGYNGNKPIVEVNPKVV